MSLQTIAEADLAATLENTAEWAASAAHTYPNPGYGSSETLTGYFAAPGEKLNMGQDVDLVEEVPIFVVRSSQAGNVAEASRLVINSVKYLVTEILSEGLISGGLTTLRLTQGDWT